MRSARSVFWAGVRAELPLLVGVLPFGMIYGALALNAGISPVAAQSMSWIVFAGPWLVIVATIAIVNLRHMLYSASTAPHVASLSPRWKGLLAYLLTDEAYAVAITHYQEEGLRPYSQWYFLGAGLALWATWQVSTALGIALGSVIPESWPLDFALPVTFIALVMPVLKDRAAVGAALAAGTMAIVANSMPYKLGLILAALTGIAVGMLLERRK